MAFRFTNRETGEIIETDEPVEYWMLLREQAERDVQAWHDARVEALSLRSALSGLKSDLENIEASMRLDAQIDGGNAETRKAQLEHLLHGDEAWIDKTDAIRDVEHDVGVWESTAEAAHSRYRLALRDLELMAALYGVGHGRE